MNHRIIAFPTLSPWLHVALSAGETPLDHLWSRLDRMENAPLTVVVPAPDDTGPGAALLEPLREKIAARPEATLLILERESAAESFEQLHEGLPAATDQLLWIDGDAPFFSLALTRYLEQLHQRSWCDYTFGDGFPAGYAPQLLRREILPVLAALARSREIRWSRSVLFDSLSVDINAFDIETEAASEDYSLLRAALTVDNRANFLLCRRLAERGVTERGLPERSLSERDVAEPAPAGAPAPALQSDPFAERYRDDQDPLLQVLLREPAIMRTVPRYYQIQVTDRRTQYPVYTPWSTPAAGAAHDMSAAVMTAVLEEIKRETPEAIISIGYRGEPGVYPDLPLLFRALASCADLQLYVETSGAGWTEENLKALENDARPVAIIVELDAHLPETYTSLRGEGREEVLRFIDRMRTAHPGRVYVQATRMKENEWELQDFYRHWSSVAGVHTIIQKYNNFAGRLPDRRVADLRPLERVPCRHLEREMTILLDGRVVRCHQDIDEETVRGSLASDTLPAIWERGLQDFLDHLGQRYPALCENCDEFYTINA